MSTQAQNPNKKGRYDLEDRTANFGEQVVKFLKQLPQDAISTPLISQLVRSSTSIGANYMEADAAESKADFRHKIRLCKKESKETMHWLRMVAALDQTQSDACQVLWREAHELLLIFSSIVKKTL